MIERETVRQIDTIPNHDSKRKIETQRKIERKINEKLF